MRKKTLMILFAGIFVFAIGKYSFAMMCGGHSEHQQIAQVHAEHEHGATETSKEAVSEEAVNVGNKVCPISGEKIDEKMKTTYEYEGKIYNFCCAMCIEEFKKDPEKYIKKIEEELQAESKGQSEHEMEMMQGAETMHQGMDQGTHQGHHH